MSVVGIRNRLNRAVAKMPPPPVTRESIEAKLRACGLDVEACWRWVLAEDVSPYRIRQMAVDGTLLADVERYKDMTGSYHEKVQS